MEERTMRGRYPAGPEYVESLDGSEQAKKRLRTVLETMTGTTRVQEACRILEISEQRFYQLREELLQAALERLEGRPAGRPRKGQQDPMAQALEDKVAEMEAELEAAHVREEIAIAMPHLLHELETGKKTLPRPKRKARPGWWRK
jgi:hypothetical protein